MSEDITGDSVSPKYKWYILTLAALTHTIAVAIPHMAMPVLFDEISKDLGLNLVQVGWVWGISALTGILTGLAGGTLGDRFGTKRVLAVSCILGGMTCALRGLSSDYVSLIVTSLLYGLVPAGIPMNVHKVCGIWFPGRLGFANGIVSAGMALGFMLGSALSASVLSPWLGGWRQVLYLYGAISIIVGILWSFTQASPVSVDAQAHHESKVSLKKGIPYVARVRNIWFVGLAMLGISACIGGTLGYLPLYLRRIGWPEIGADAALATFHGISLIAAIPIALLSDRLGSRRKMVMAATLMIAAGIGLLSFSTGSLVWVGVCIAGVVRDGFMAILMTMIIEVKAIGAKYAGTAIGFVMIFSRTGNLISPPLGNSLAEYNPAIPFIFWAVLALMGLLGFYFFKEER
jgi:NNP family nitrate/nitrite transporter-like MFS transporter